MSTNQETVSNPVEDALRVMGAEQVYKDLFHLPRVGAHAYAADLSLYDIALFIHECKLYLREKGYAQFNAMHFTDYQDSLSCRWAESAPDITVEAWADQGEYTLYALAVLSTVPPQVGEVKG